MPYHEVSMENGAREMIRRPSWPRKASASQTKPMNPEHRSARLKTLHAPPADSLSDCRGEIEPNAAIAERYMRTHHQFPDQPSAAVSGVSCTIRIPIAMRDNVRMTT